MAPQDLPKLHIPRRRSTLRPHRSTDPSSSPGPSAHAAPSVSPSHLSPTPMKRPGADTTDEAGRRRRRSTGLSPFNSAAGGERASFSTSRTGSWDEVSVSGGETEPEEWEAGSSPGGTGGAKRAGRDGTREAKEKGEMKPLTVVFYMLALYAIFGILTRSDDLEIMPHLPGGLQAQFAPSARPDQHHGYQIPYHLPHLPSVPVPDGTQVSTVRLVLGWAVYPIYLAITLLTIPLPLILNVLHLAWQILRVVLSPLTGSAKVLLRFAAFPIGLLTALMDALYPVWVLVGGTIGAGCVLGGTAGWAGSWVLEKLTGRRSRRQAEQERDLAREKERTRRRKLVRRRSSRAPLPAADPVALSTTNTPGRQAGVRGRTVSPSSGEDLLVRTPEPVKEERAGLGRRAEGVERVREWDGARATGRKEMAVGTRRRGHSLRGDD